MGRAPCCEKNGLKRGPWTPEEDKKLIDYIQKHGYGNWRTLPKNAGLQRCGKSCRLRWTNYLRPDIKRGRFSFEEEEAIVQLHRILGNKWSAIAARLPGRTDNEIKNYWNTHIRKRLIRMGIDPVTHSPRLDLLDLSPLLNSSLYNNSCNSPCQLNISRLLAMQQMVNPELLRTATSVMPSSQCERSNPQFAIQNGQENQLQIQSQVSQLAQLQEIPSPTLPFPGGAHLMNPIPQQLISNAINFDESQCLQLNEWESSGIDSSLCQDNICLPGYGQNYYPSDNQPILNSDQSFSFGTSVFSTPSSSPTPLNSNSTYLTSSTEDERESHCGDMLKFEFPDILQVSEFM